MSSSKKNFLLLFFFALISCGNEQSKTNLSDVWTGEDSSGFRELKAVEAEKYMIASANKLASQTAEKILLQGGNAVDAAIAAQMVLNVVEPHSSGIGGGAFLIYYDAKLKKTFYFNGRETAPQNANSKIFLDKNGKPREFSDAVQGGLSVGTPGLLKMLDEVHKKYGKLPWPDLFKPAIKIADEGFAVSERFHVLSNQVKYLKNFDETAEIYLDKNRKPHEAGAVIKNPKLAQTFATIAKEGIDVFYNGQIAKDIVAAVQNSKINPGFLALEDFKNYQTKKGDLTCNAYRKKYKICVMGLPGGGVTLLQILGILENFDLAKMQLGSKETVHLISEAARLAYADRAEYIADLKGVPVKEMLDKNYLKNRAALIDPNKAMEKVESGKFSSGNNLVGTKSGFERPSTTHLSIIDAEGNAVAMTSSIEYFFGSAISVDGFLLNNQLTDFSFEDEKDGKKVANRLEPGKQPRSAMTPTFVFDENNKLIMIAGSPGGPRIIQFVLKEIINHLDFGLDVQQSISAPNFVVLNNVIELEKNREITKLKPELEAMGHQVKVVDIVSGVNAITIENNKIQGGADPRREGFALGL